MAPGPAVIVTGPTDVRCDDGVTGHAIVFAYTPAVLGPLGAFLLGLRSLLVGTSDAPLAASARSGPGRTQGPLER